MGAPADGSGSGITGYGNRNFKKNPFGATVNLATKTSPLGFVRIAGYNVADPLDVAGNKKTDSPPSVSAPPPSADTTSSMLREISRSETDAEIRRSKRQSYFGSNGTGNGSR